MKARFISVALAVVAVAAVTFMLAKPGSRMHRLELRAYFKDVQGLRAGADVRIAGVKVGQVKSVEARPERKESAGEVVLAIETSYPLQIPNDARAGIETAGILGEPFVAIDLSKSQGVPVSTGGVLPVRETFSLEKTIVDALSSTEKHYICVADSAMKEIDCKAVQRPSK